MSFEDGMYLAIMMMAGGSIVLGAVVGIAARLGGRARKAEARHAGR